MRKMLDKNVTNDADIATSLNNAGTCYFNMG